MSTKYILLRLIRRFMPEMTAKFLLRRGIFIKAGLETRMPQIALDRYLLLLRQQKRDFQDQRVMVFGYGGNFAIGCLLLENGASHVVLCDKYAKPNRQGNMGLLPAYAKYLSKNGSQVEPDPTYLTLLHEDIKSIAAERRLTPVDILLSNSVFEHLEDVDGICQALASLTDNGGCHLHFIDLRDHYFSLPFEMLKYSKQAWDKWLNPGSNLNRLRTKDYETVFRKYFRQVNITSLEQEREAFEKASPEIRPEFLTGDPEIDATTLIQVFATEPIL